MIYLEIAALIVLIGSLTIIRAVREFNQTMKMLEDPEFFEDSAFTYYPNTYKSNTYVVK